MKVRLLQAILYCMEPHPPIRRYTLVPKAAPGERPAGAPVRRFSLARVSPSPRSALGEDRHERLERAAGHPPR